MIGLLNRSIIKFRREWEWILTRLVYSYISDAIEKLDVPSQMKENKIYMSNVKQNPISEIILDLKERQLVKQLESIWTVDLKHGLSSAPQSGLGQLQGKEKFQQFMQLKKIAIYFHQEQIQRHQLSQYSFDYLHLYFLKNQNTYCLDIISAHKLLLQQQQSKPDTTQLSVQKLEEDTKENKEAATENEEDNQDKKYQQCLLTPPLEIQFLQNLNKGIQEKGATETKFPLFPEYFTYEYTMQKSILRGQAKELGSEVPASLACKNAMKAQDRLMQLDNFMERKIFSESDPHPSVLRVGINNAEQSITCVEFTPNCNILLCGCMESAILLFLVNPGFLEEFAPPKTQMELEQPPQDRTNADEQGTAPTNTDLKLAHRFIGHEGAVMSLSLLYDELFFLSASMDLTIRLWCIRQKVCLMTYKGHLKTIWKVKFAPFGNFFASGSSDCSILLWTTDQFKYDKVLLGHKDDVTHLEFNQNQTYLASASTDGSIILWDVKAGKEIKKLNQLNACSALSISYSGQYLLVGLSTGQLQLWNLAKFELINETWIEPQTNPNPILCAHMSMDETMIVCNSCTTLAYFSTKKFNQKTFASLTHEMYIGKDNYEEQNKINRFGKIEPENIFEIASKQQAFLRALFHNKNFLVAITK